MENSWGFYFAFLIVSLGFALDNLRALWKAEDVASRILFALFSASGFAMASWLFHLLETI